MSHARRGWLLLALGASALAQAGTIKGKVSFSGDAPALKAVDRSSDPACQPAGAAALNDETVLLTKDRKLLQNAVIRLDNEPPAVTPPTAPVQVEQTGCAYRPRVQVAQVGQPIAVKNADETLHNVHAYAGTKGLFNVAQPPGPKVVQKPAPAGTDVVKLKCDVHPWMVGWVVFSKGPHAAVTGADGTFTLSDVPPGTYKISAWHEKLGLQVQDVVVAEGKTATANFTLPGK